MAPPGVRLFNSASRQVEPFVPLVPGQAGIYDCGPTVYDWQTIGNLYRYIVSDVQRRTLEYLGYRVKAVMNITDVGHIAGDVDEGEDRMMIAAKREGRDPETLARKYTEQFLIDRQKLNILPPHVMPKATAHIPEMIQLIRRLIDKGNAYVAADGVYFDTTTFPGYGTRLNAEPPQERVAGARVDVNPNKRNPTDFALWRAKKPGDLQFWDSPWGAGNPGWHIDCTREALKGAQSRLDRWRGIIRDAWQSTGGTPIDVAPEDPRRTTFVAALTDDLNTPAALAQAEAVLDLATTGDVATQRHALEVLFDMDQVLALSLRERASDADLSAEERAALAERDEARKKGDYKRSDELRVELERRYGIRVKDTKDGTRWERVRRKGA